MRNKNKLDKIIVEARKDPAVKQYERYLDSLLAQLPRAQLIELDTAINDYYFESLYKALYIAQHKKGRE